MSAIDGRGLGVFRAPPSPIISETKCRSERDEELFEYSCRDALNPKLTFWHHGHHFGVFKVYALGSVGLAANIFNSSKANYMSREGTA